MVSLGKLLCMSAGILDKPQHSLYAQLDIPTDSGPGFAQCCLPSAAALLPQHVVFFGRNASMPGLAYP